MKIKLDENIPFRLKGILSRLGHNIDTVFEEGLKGKDDPEIWTASQAAGRLLITQDLDFSDIRRFTPGTHCGVMLIRLHNAGRKAITARIQRIFETEDTANWEGSFIVLTESKLRILFPPVQI